MAAMDGAGLRRLRERLGLERDELAGAINSALGKSYSAETIGRWERGRPITRSVSAFLEELAVSGGLELAGGRVDDAGDEHPGVDPSEWQPPGSDGPQDTAPGAGRASAPPAQPALLSGGAWARSCEELFELIATGVGMIGAATGSLALMNDGAIIAADKQALGAAWGKLAETNETFRKMLIGMTEGGAWLQVALVTGTTVSKCWQGHELYRQQTEREGAENGSSGHPAEAAAA